MPIGACSEIDASCIGELPVELLANKREVFDTNISLLADGLPLLVLVLMSEFISRNACCC